MFSPLTKLILGISVMFLVPFALLSWVNFNASKDWARQEVIGEALPLTRDNIYSEIHADLIEPILVSSTMANDAFLKEWVVQGEEDPERVQRFLLQIHRKYGYFSVFFVSAKSNKYYHYEKGLHKVISPENDHDQWFYNFIKSGQEFDLDVDTDEAGGDALTIFINFRLMDLEGNLLGVTGVGMKMEQVSQFLEETGKRYNKGIYLVSKEGAIQAHADAEKVDRLNINDKPGIKGIADQILSLDEEPADFAYELEGRSVLLTARYMPELKWFLIVEQDESTALASARSNFVRTLVVGTLLWVLAIAVSIFLARRHQVRLEQLARTDPLTDLPNRRLFIEQFDAAMSRTERGGKPHALIIMDLDGFKQVNDQLGHNAGDKVLLEVTEAMKQAIRPSDVLARWGGDEFIVLTECSGEDAGQIADRIREAVTQLMSDQADLPDKDPRRQLSVSCGVVYCGNEKELDTLVQRADELLYACKREGGNKVKVKASM